MITKLIEIVYAFLWGDLFTLPVMGSSVGISLMLLLLIPAGIYFTIRTRLLPLRLFSDMMKALKEKKETPDSLSSLQTLIISTATRVGMGNLVGVVAAVSAGWCRCRILDVGDCPSGCFYRLCRSCPGSTIQRDRTLFTAAITEDRLTTFTILSRAKTGQNPQTFPDCLPCLPSPA